MTKEALRQHYRSLRATLSKQEIEKRSAVIANGLIQHPAWKKSRTVLIYRSFGSEVSTKVLIDQGLKDRKRVAVPVGRDSEKIAIELFKDQKELPLSEVDLVIIPGLVYDRRGARIGSGGGWFDRLLARCPNAFRIAPAFSLQLHDTPLPQEPTDVPMHLLITEKEILSCR